MQVSFPLNRQDEGDTDEDDNIDPSLCFFTSIQTNNPAITEPMQVDKSIVEVKDQKEPLQKRLGFENNR